ncbi:hypothetical protein [uncultured Thermosynechococcus sp.]|uniref:hypothetical protein n=1 Tax=uncultured Thermosynechococcus sp. TaxID=436945 RepID=UPI002620194E|nr:hypothetical protein [uncultured Thermosynechococcus sp.]
MSTPAEQIKNLDIRCAETGQQLARISELAEKDLNDALAVLEDQGPYAMFLYAKARFKGEVYEGFQKPCIELLRGVFDSKLQNLQDALKAVKQLAEDLDDLLFARDLLRSALSYARYHLKAKGSK